jgi:hypothetical protein
MGPTPFLNDALIRSLLTGKMAALKTSIRRSPSQPEVSQLNDLVRTYHGILGTLKMRPETALGVLSKLAPPSSRQPTQTRDDLQDAALALQIAQQNQQRQFQTLSNMMKTIHDTSSSIIQNLK